MIAVAAYGYSGDSKTTMQFVFCSEECRAKFEEETKTDLKGRPITWQDGGMEIGDERPGCDYCPPCRNTIGDSSNNPL